MSTRYEEDTQLDAPDAGVRATLLKPPGSWSGKERKRMATRMQVEDSLGLNRGDQNSVRFGLPGTTQQNAPSVDPGFVQNAPAPSGPPTHDDALAGAGTGVWSGPRGGNRAFEGQMQDHGDYMAGINDGSVKPPAGITTPPAALRTQIPGTNYQPNKRGLGQLAPGQEVRVPTPGGPGAFSVSQLPPGFTSYQNADGGWTVIGTDGKAQRFASEQDAAGWLNGTPPTPADPTIAAPSALSPAATPQAPSGPSGTPSGQTGQPNPSTPATSPSPSGPSAAPSAPAPGYADASGAGRARMRDESANPAPIAPEADPRPSGKGMGTPRKTSQPAPRGVEAPSWAETVERDRVANHLPPADPVLARRMGLEPAGGPVVAATNPAPAPSGGGGMPGGVLNPFRMAGTNAAIAGAGNQPQPSAPGPFNRQFSMADQAPGNPPTAPSPDMLEITPQVPEPPFSPLVDQGSADTTPPAVDLGPAAPAGANRTPATSFLNPFRYGGTNPAMGAPATENPMQRQIRRGFTQSDPESVRSNLPTSVPAPSRNTPVPENPTAAAPAPAPAPAVPLLRPPNVRRSEEQARAFSAPFNPFQRRTFVY